MQNCSNNVFKRFCSRTCTDSTLKRRLKFNCTHNLIKMRLFLLSLSPPPSQYLNIFLSLTRMQTHSSLSYPTLSLSSTLSVSFNLLRFTSFSPILSFFLIHSLPLSSLPSLCLSQVFFSTNCLCIFSLHAFLCFSISIVLSFSVYLSLCLSPSLFSIFLSLTPSLAHSLALPFSPFLAKKKSFSRKTKKY
jgi:hypothetical protein